MIWLLGGIIFLLLIVIVEGYALLRCYKDGFRALDKACKFQPYEFRCNAVDQPCLYSPGSEPERICVLREEDKKNKGQGTGVQLAPQWIDRTPPGE